MPIKLDARIGRAVPDQPVVLSKIKEMTDRYRTNLPPKDAISCWVSKKEVLKLLRQNKGTGIRIYYGRHADDEGVEFAKKHNCILVATIDDVTPASPTSDNSNDQLNQYKANGPVNSVIVSFKGAGDDAIPLCPPHCPTPSVLSPKQ